MGSSHPLVRKPGPDRPQGDLDNIGAVRANEKLLSCADGAWNQLPTETKIPNVDSHAAIATREFLLHFNGNLLKDPRLCLTISVWQELCPQLERVVFCLRNPLSVLRYLEKRHFIPKDQGVMLWCEYVLRFARNIKLPVIVMDYDQLFVDPAKTGSPFPVSKDELLLLRKECNEFPFDPVGFEALPEPVRKLYGLVRSGQVFRSGTTSL